MNELRLIRLAGGPADQGRAFGRATADLVAHNLEIYFKRFLGETYLDRAEVLRRVDRYWPVVETEAPVFAATVAGIAEGAAQPLPVVAALNLRYELLYAEFSRLGQAEPEYRYPAGECTAFAVLPETSTDGHLRIGQNWDWIPDVAGVLVHVTQPGGLRVLCFTEAGIAGGKIGANSAGVGLVVNGLVSSDDDWTRMGRPFHARTWDILCSTRLEDAVKAVSAGDRACSANFLIAQAGPLGRGEAVDIEAAPRGVCLQRPRGGVFAHANHFLEPERLGISQPLVEERLSTYHRCDRMQQMLAAGSAHGRIAPDALQAMLRDHDGLPESVCRHPNPRLHEPDRYQTVVSMIMDLHAGRVLAAAGPPCANAFVEYVV